MPQSIPGGQPGAQPARTPTPTGLPVRSPNYNYYDAGDGNQHVYDQNWRYKFTHRQGMSESPQIAPNFGGESMARSSMMSSPDFSPEPTPIPGVGGGNPPPPTPIQGMINGVPIGSNGQPTVQTPTDPNNLSQGVPLNPMGPGTGLGGWGGYGYQWTGPGQVYGQSQPGGTQLAYPTQSYFDPQLGWVARGQSTGGSWGGSGASGATPSGWVNPGYTGPLSHFGGIGIGGSGGWLSPTAPNQAGAQQAFQRLYM